MQAKKSVEVDGGIRAAALRFGNRDARPHAVIIRFAKGHDDVQTVRRAALKQYDELLLVRHRCCGDGALQKHGHGAETHQRHATLLEEIPPREFQPAQAFTAFVAHCTLSIPGLRFYCSAALWGGIFLVGETKVPR